MPTNITSVAGWVTPQTVVTGDAISSTVWNNLVGDVAMLYGKPWFMAYLTTASTTGPIINGGASLSTHTGLISCFASASGSWSTLYSTSGLGAFSLNTIYNCITFPTSSGSVIPGLYRITAQMTMDGVASSIYNKPMIVIQGGSGVISYHPGTITQGSGTGIFSTMSTSVTLPIGSSTWSTATNFFVTGITTNSSALKLQPNDATGVSGFGPASTPPQFNTYVMVEYLGTSTGNF